MTRNKMNLQRVETVCNVADVECAAKFHHNNIVDTHNI